jgi:hypothetical protein
VFIVTDNARAKGGSLDTGIVVYYAEIKRELHDDFIKGE